MYQITLLTVQRAPNFALTIKPRVLIMTWKLHLTGPASSPTSSVPAPFHHCPPLFPSLNMASLSHVNVFLNSLPVAPFSFYLDQLKYHLLQTPCLKGTLPSSPIHSFFSLLLACVLHSTSDLFKLFCYFSLPLLECSPQYPKPSLP